MQDARIQERDLPQVEDHAREPGDRQLIQVGSHDADHVDVILGSGASSSSIATMGVAAQKKRIYLATDPASSDITGKLCNPYTVHWVYDTAALANGTGSAVVKAGGKKWFFLTADYAFGYALERDVTAVVKPGAANQISILTTRTFFNELGTGGMLGPAALYREK